MKNRRSVFGVSVTCMLLAISFLLFVMLGGCGEDTPATTTQPQQTGTNGESVPQTTLPQGTVVISPTEDESDPGSIEIVLPNTGDGEDGEEGGSNTGNTGSTGNTGNTGNTTDPTVPTQSGNTPNPKPTDPTLPTQSGDGDNEQGNQGGNENNGPVGDEDDRVDLEVDFDDLFN